MGKIKNKLDFISKLNDLLDRKEKIGLFGVILSALAMAVFQAVGVASVLPFIKTVLDTASINQSKWLTYAYNFFAFDSTRTFIIFLGFVVLGLLVAGNLVSAFATWLKIRFVWQKNYKLSNCLLKKYVLMPYTFFLNHNTANLSKNVLMEVNQLTASYIFPLINIFTGGVITIVILGLLLLVNPAVTMVAAAVLVSLYFLIYWYFSEKIRRGGQLRLKENKERFRLAAETLGGIKDIKILGVEKFFLDRYSEHSGSFSNVQSQNQIISQLPRYLMEVIAFGGIVGILIFSVSSNLPTGKIIPLVSFFAFAGYRLLPALQEIFNSMTMARFNRAVLDKIHADMFQKQSIHQGADLKQRDTIPLPFREKIELKDIFFSYPPNRKDVLKGISLSIEKNTFVAFIGATGSGKTTIADIILGLLTHYEGKILIDGVEIDKQNIRNWQANLGYVPQQIFLSDDSVARNIAFGLPDGHIDMAKVKKAAEMANIRDFVEKELPEGYDTFIGERGVRLSGGQRQRIGIARALYHDPQVLLLDEATSSLDNKTENEVLAAIENVAKMKTMIVIAHRLTTVKNCDKVYVVEKGRIAKVGSYDEIVRKT